MNGYLKVEYSPRLQGEVSLVGAKNAVLPIMASLILTEGKSKLTNVPYSDDVLMMKQLLQDLGAHVFFDKDKTPFLLSPILRHSSKGRSEKVAAFPSLGRKSMGLITQQALRQGIR